MEGDTLSIASALLSAKTHPEQSISSLSAVQNSRNNLQQKKISCKNNSPKKEALVSSSLYRASGKLYRRPTDIPLLLKTTDLLIINKPAGIPVHGDYSIEALLFGSAQLSPDTPPSAVSGTHPQQSLSFKQGPLHRLDKDTTGILCLSRTLAGAQWFSQCLRKKTVDKYYLGIVRGALSMQLITAENESGKTMTQCYLLAYNQEIDASLMLFKLITGKKHQIRKHTSNVGHPLVGDRKYLGGNPLPDCTRYQLHAWRLYFPVTRPTDIPPFIEAPFFSEMETSLRRDFPGWRKKAAAILTTETQAAGNF
ncbi:MAG: RluA family pseudouridine synthase [Treponema sp.]